MLRTTKYRSLTVAAAAALFANFTVCSAMPAHPGASPVVKQSTKKTVSPGKSTFCMGRFLIDVPAGSTLTGGRYEYNFVSINRVKPSNLEEFEREVADRESILRSAINERTKERMLIDSVEAEKDTKILVSWKEKSKTDELAISAYRWKNGSRFLFEKTVDKDKKDKGMTAMSDVLHRGYAIDQDRNDHRPRGQQWQPAANLADRQTGSQDVGRDPEVLAHAAATGEVRIGYCLPELVQT